MAQQLGYFGLDSDYPRTLVREWYFISAALETPYNSVLSSTDNPLRAIRKEDETTEHPIVDTKLLFQEVFDEHYHSLLYYAKCFLPDIDTARDVVQEVFSNFWIKKDTIKDKKAIKSFLFVSTRNKCIDVLRHTKLKRENERKLCYFFDTDKETEHISDLEAEVTAASTLTLIHKAIEELPDKYKDVVRLSFYDNLNVDEIASRLQLPYHTIYARKSRAIDRLKRSLLKYGTLMFLVIVNQLLK